MARTGSKHRFSTTSSAKPRSESPRFANAVQEHARACSKALPHFLLSRSGPACSRQRLVWLQCATRIMALPLPASVRMEANPSREPRARVRVRIDMVVEWGGGPHAVVGMACMELREDNVPARSSFAVVFRARLHMISPPGAAAVGKALMPHRWQTAECHATRRNGVSAGLAVTVSVGRPPSDHYSALDTVRFSWSLFIGPLFSDL